MSDTQFSQWLHDLLALPTAAQQLATLRATGQLTATGLPALLDAAERLVGANPDHAYQLTQLCESACLSTNHFALLPRTAYLQAQIHAIRGEFDRAQGLIETARSGYEKLGMTLDALRTTVGLMRVLGETGRYVEALQTGQRALVQLSSVVAAGAVAPPIEAEPDVRVIAAMLLQNCGACYEQIGRDEEALAAYAAAEARYQSLAMVEQQAAIIENRGAVLMAQGRVADALAAFTYAQTIYAAAGLAFYQAQTLINIGEAQLLLSNYMPSLHAFTEAMRLFAQLGNAVDQPILLRQLGDAYLALNLHAEALDSYGQANAGLERAGLTLHHALALWGLGATQIARHQWRAAQQSLAAAATMLTQLDHRPLLSALLLEQSRLLEITTDAAQAQKLAHQALALVEGSNWTVQKIYAYLRNADLAFPDLAKAEGWLTAAQQWSATVELPQLRYRLAQRWGHLRLLQGDLTRAQAHLEEALTEIERLRSTLVQEQLRISFLADKYTAYQDLLLVHLHAATPAGTAAAFAVTERAKSRALVDLISGALEGELADAPDEQTAGQLQSYQAELNAIYNEMLGSRDESPPRSAKAPGTLNARAAELEQAISHLRLQGSLAHARNRRSTEGELRSLLPLDLSPVAPHALALADGLALIVYHVVGDEILAFVRIGAELQLLRHLATVPDVHQLLQRLTAQWVHVRTDQALLRRHQRQLEHSAQRLLQTAYRALMAPVVQWLQTAAPAVRWLVIVPHRFLHQLPFHAFHDGTHYLVEAYAISYAPSATVFALCQQRPLQATRNALVVGVPDAQIPAVTTEVEEVVRQLRAQGADARLLLADAATLPTVTAAAAGCSQLHLACHGLFRHDNPFFSALKLNDGWLTVSTIAQLKLPGALVTLSACESGRSQIMGGDESIGLVYAFLSAGAATLLVSQWLVQDEITACFMTQWYAQLATATDLDEALRQAQLQTLAHHRHPYYWAPFVLIGQRTLADQDKRPPRTAFMHT